MIIKTTHKNIKSLTICSLCFKPLQKGIEKKRGTCLSCNEQYVIKNNLKKWINKENED